MEIQTCMRTWKRLENQEDDQKGFGMPTYINEREKTEHVFQIF